MNEFPDIINSQIVSNEYDVFWTTPDELAQLTPRKVLVASTPFLPGSAEETQLKKMLQACQLREEDYHIVQFSDDMQIAWHALRDQLGVKSVLLLGVTPVQLGVSAQLMPHQLSRFNDCNWIVTDSLEVLIQRPEIKAHLWNYGLKPAFVDKVYG
jgi:hypothetical protein